MTKRYRKVPVKEGHLRIKYGRDEDGELGLVVANGVGCSRGDIWLLYGAFFTKQCRSTIMDKDFPKNPGPLDYIAYGPSLIEELETRGYDINTLEFTIKKKEV